MFPRNNGTRALASAMTSLPEFRSSNRINDLYHHFEVHLDAMTRDLAEMKQSRARMETRLEELLKLVEARLPSLDVHLREQPIDFIMVKSERIKSTEFKIPNLEKDLAIVDRIEEEYVEAEADLNEYINSKR